MTDTANYRGALQAAETWRRCRRVLIDNKYGTIPMLSMLEEEVILTPSGAMRRDTADLQTEFDPALEIPVINPMDLRPTGETVYAGDVYVMIFSLYMLLAARRDAEEAAPTKSA
jgi:hypothetical protein